MKKTFIITITFILSVSLYAQQQYSQSYQKRVREIMRGVITSDAFLTRAIHKEFWLLLNQANISSPKDLKILRDIMVGMFVDYQQLFWEDALKSLEAGRPIKSYQRKKLEERYLKLKLMTKARIETNSQTMRKIAYKEKLVSRNREMIVNKEKIELILARLYKASRNLEKLFTKPVY